MSIPVLGLGIQGGVNSHAFMDDSALAEIDGRTWEFWLAAGVLTTASRKLTSALRLEAVSQISPLINVSLAFGIAFAAIFLREQITWQIVCGGLLMLAGAFFIASPNTDNKSSISAPDNPPNAAKTE